jgi:hypothetical protein
VGVRPYCQYFRIHEGLFECDAMPAVMDEKDPRVQKHFRPVHPSVWKLMEECWSGDPEKRPSLNKIYEVFV